MRRLQLLQDLLGVIKVGLPAVSRPTPSPIEAGGAVEPWPTLLPESDRRLMDELESGRGAGESVGGCGEGRPVGCDEGEGRVGCGESCTDCMGVGEGE